MLSDTDRLDIVELVTRADDAATRRDADGYVAFFADDAVLDGEKGEHRGKDRLRQSVGPIWESEGPMTAHCTVNIVVNAVDDDPDRAIATSLLLILRNEIPVSIASLSFITQHLVRVGSRWLIERRSVQPGAKGLKLVSDLLPRERGAPTGEAGQNRHAAPDRPGTTDRAARRPGRNGRGAHPTREARRSERTEARRQGFWGRGRKVARWRYPATRFPAPSITGRTSNCRDRSFEPISTDPTYCSGNSVSTTHEPHAEGRPSDRTCSKCGVTKATTEFASRGRGLLSSHCWDCVGVENREYYERNKARLQDEARDRQRQKVWTEEDRARRADYVKQYVSDPTNRKKKADKNGRGMSPTRSQ